MSGPQDLNNSAGTGRPVPFELFSRLIINLDDIVSRIQRDGVAGVAAQSSEECGHWYYEKFYESPDIREQYPYEIGACPRGIKLLLESKPTELIRPPAGRFLFPVSFEIFMRYINYNELIGPILTAFTSDVSKRYAVLRNPGQCQKIFHLYYHSFYLLRKVREQFQYRFNTDDEELRQKLLSYGSPMDKAAEIMLKEANKIEQSKDSLPVSFKMFKRHLKNLSNIVEQMLRCAEHQGKSVDQLEREYYITFYTMPQSRHKYEFKLKPCPALIRDKLLSFVQTEADNNNNEDWPMETKADHMLVTFSFDFPVSFDIFKQYINFDDLKLDLIKTKTSNKHQIKKMMRDESGCLKLLHHYYYDFYIDDDDGSARKMFNYSFERASADLRAQLELPGRFIGKVETPMSSLEEAEATKAEAVPPVSKLIHLEQTSEQNQSPASTEAAAEDAKSVQKKLRHCNVLINAINNRKENLLALLRSKKAELEATLYGPNDSLDKTAMEVDDKAVASADISCKASSEKINVNEVIEEPTVATALESTEGAKELDQSNIKQEQPFKLLNNMRFTINNNKNSADEGFDCEIIKPEEQIINLDYDDYDMFLPKPKT